MSDRNNRALGQWTADEDTAPSNTSLPPSFLPPSFWTVRAAPPAQDPVIENTDYVFIDETTGRAGSLAFHISQGTKGMGNFELDAELSRKRGGLQLYLHNVGKPTLAGNTLGRSGVLRRFSSASNGLKDEYPICTDVSYEIGVSADQLEEIPLGEVSVQAGGLTSRLLSEHRALQASQYQPRWLDEKSGKIHFVVKPGHDNTLSLTNCDALVSWRSATGGELESRRVKAMLSFTNENPHHWEDMPGSAVQSGPSRG